MDVEVTRTSTAPPDEVWAIMTDLERTAEVLSSVTGIERLDDGDGVRVGTRWRETRELFGREASEELEVTAIDEDARRYVVEADRRGTHYRSQRSVSPDGEGSLLRMTFGAEASGLTGRLMARTVGRALETGTREALQQDLDDIAQAAEAAATEDA